MSGSRKVLADCPVLTKTLAARIISQSAHKMLMQWLPGSQDALGDELGCDGKTVSNAVSGDHLISVHTVFNLLRVDAYALEGLLGHFGRRSVPIEAKCNTDELVPLTRAVSKLAEARSKGAMTDYECLEIEPDVEAAVDALLVLKDRCEAIRKARAA